MSEPEAIVIKLNFKLAVTELIFIFQSPIKERKHSECSDTECDPQFKPIVALPEVEVLTNEENETELLKVRAKLYRFDSSTDPPEWKASFIFDKFTFKKNKIFIRNLKYSLFQQPDSTMRYSAL